MVNVYMEVYFFWKNKTGEYEVSILGIITGHISSSIPNM